MQGENRKPDTNLDAEQGPDNKRDQDFNKNIEQLNGKM